MYIIDIKFPKYVEIHCFNFYPKYLILQIFLLVNILYEKNCDN